VKHLLQSEDFKRCEFTCPAGSEFIPYSIFHTVNATDIQQKFLTHLELTRCVAAKLNRAHAEYKGTGKGVSPSIIRLIKSRRMRCSRHVARTEETRNVHNTLVGKPEGKRALGRPRRGRKIILKWILGKGG
jgi:hypothetical protein